MMMSVKAGERRAGKIANRSTAPPIKPTKRTERKADKTSRTPTGCSAKVATCAAATQTGHQQPGATSDCGRGPKHLNGRVEFGAVDGP